MGLLKNAVYKVGFFIGRIFIYYPNTLKFELTKDVKVVNKDIKA